MRNAMRSDLPQVRLVKGDEEATHAEIFYTAACGQEIKVGLALELDSANPMVLMTEPLGLSGMELVCKGVRLVGERTREKLSADG